jgi:hypothetical protein
MGSFQAPTEGQGIDLDHGRPRTAIRRRPGGIRGDQLGFTLIDPSLSQFAPHLILLLATLRS